MEQYQPQLEQIIDRSRREEEAFLTDKAEAARLIIEFLKTEGFERVVYLKIA
jgi:hypothetical protein